MPDTVGIYIFLDMTIPPFAPNVSVNTVDTEQVLYVSKWEEIA